MSRPPVQVLVVDDHPVVRAGLVAMLSEAGQLGSRRIEVAGEAANGAEALAFCAAHPVDVALMDLRMPVMDGAEATRRLLALPAPPQVLVLTTYDTDADIVKAIEAGACGYLLKDTPLVELAEAIVRAAAGETVLDEGVARRLAVVRQAPSTGALTTREREVLQLVAHGCSNAEVGRRLFIGEATVKTHLIRIFTKLGVNDRTAAVTVALQQGLIDLSP